MTMHSPSLVSPAGRLAAPRARLLLVSRSPGLSRVLGLEGLARRAELELVETAVAAQALALVADGDGEATVILVDHALGDADLERLIRHGSEAGCLVVVLGRRSDDTARAFALGAGDCIELDLVAPEGTASSLERLLELRRQTVEARSWRGRFHRLFDESPIGLFELDDQGRLVAANSEFGRLLGTPAAELIGTSIDDLFPALLPVGAPGWSGDAGFEAQPREVRLRRADGGVVAGWLGLRRAPSEPGSATVCEGWLLDATRETALSEAVKLREALYVELFSAMAEPTLFVDADGVVLACNQSGEELLRRRAAELVGHPLRAAAERFVVADQASGESAADHDPFASLVEQAGDRYLGLVRHDGTLAWVTARARLVRGPGQEERGHYLVSLLDDTERQALRARVQAAALDSAVAVGAAHDARNLLTVVRAAAELLHREPDGRSAADLCAQIEQAAVRASTLVGRFVAFARVREPRVERYLVDRVLAGVAALLEIVVKSTAELRIDLGAPDASLVGEPLELERAVFNLVLNARDAMSRRGTIRLVTRRAPATDTPGDGAEWLVLAVEDDGCGMSDEVREHAARPYFTTREAAGGTGLGLDNVARFALSQGGRVEIQSAAARGTAVRLWLPVAADAEESSPPGPAR